MTRFGGLAVVWALCVGACAAAKPPTTAAAEAIEVGKADPPSGSVRLKTLEVSHGGGCGGFGTVGNFDGASTLLRNEAAKIGADYVEIMTVTEPHMEKECRRNEYKIIAVAYRTKGTTSAGPDSAKEAAPPKAEANAAAVCVPGATQECLGPGACKGAQACRDNGAGYMPCDCGNAAVPPATAN
jgi:hypothetical protein